MGFIELLLIAIGLSLDAMAVALCKGLAQTRSNPRQGMVIAAYFGAFQALMPLLGWFIGRQFERYVTAIDHWISFALLLVIGGKMVVGVLRGSSCDLEAARACRAREMLALAVATSIDAFAIGVTFAFLQVAVLPAVMLIGMTTLLLSLTGYFLGNRLGTRFGSLAELAGGIVLILMGSKILLEHLELLPF